MAVTLIGSLLLVGVGLRLNWPATGVVFAQGGSAINCPTFSNGSSSGSSGNVSIVAGTVGQWMIASGTSGNTQLNSGAVNCLTAAVSNSNIYLPILLK